MREAPRSELDRWVSASDSERPRAGEAVRGVRAREHRPHGEGLTRDRRSRDPNRAASRPELRNHPNMPEIARTVATLRLFGNGPQICESGYDDGWDQLRGGERLYSTVRVIMHEENP